MSDWLLALGRATEQDPLAQLEDLLERWETLPGSAFDRAVAAGLLSDRLGLAFAGGYRSALMALTGQPGHAALCITEKGGAHPRAIATRLQPQGDGFVISGHKTWSTLAGRARTLLVAASAGTEGDRNLIRVVRVPVDAPGLALQPMPPTAFTPEIPHFQVELSQVSVPADAVLPGDGYLDTIKPFRTVEDIHVIAAATAHVVGVGRRARWPAAVLCEGIGLVAALASLAARPPLEPAVHLALGGVLRSFEAWLHHLEEHWAEVAPDISQRWARDRPLLKIASRARAARFARAAAESGLPLERSVSPS